jgi:integrase
MPIRDIRAANVLRVIKKIEERGTLDVASRVKQRISPFCRYAIQLSHIELNTEDALKDVKETRKITHRKSLKLDQLPAFLNSLDS